MISRLHRRTRALAVALPTVAALSVGMLTVGAGQAAAVNPAATVNATAHVSAMPWSYQATAGRASYSPAQATQQARDFDVIAANRLVYGNAVPDMLAANPNLKLLAYVNGAYAQSTEGTAFPDSWYLRSAAGDKVRSRAYGNYLMDVNNAGWTASVVQRCRSVMAQAGFTGCFIDMMGTASILPGYANALPVDPQTGEHYTYTEWLAATSTLSQSVQTQLGADVPVYVNGLGSGPRYFSREAPSSQLLDGIGGALAESWLRGAEQRLSWYPAEKQWLTNVDMLADGAARGKTILLTVKAWGAGTDAERDAWHVYSLATYLMGADGRAQYSWLASAKGDPTAQDSMLTGLQIGTPTGAYFRNANGAYERDFTNGKVLVNPTKAAVTVPLSRTHTTVSGTPVTTVTLAPNQAQILTVS